MRRAIRELRSTIDCLPVRTREAMLEGVRANRIVAGAYTRDGAVCPMLAAHRHGGRTSFIAFARAWDRFCGAKKPRRATRREVRILIAELEDSLTAGRTRGADLAAAVAEHQRLARDRRAREAAEDSARGPASGRDQADYMSVSPGLMNWISGTMHAGETDSRNRTDSAMSDGVIISSGAT
jgi:hypothetical protein